MHDDEHDDEGDRVEIGVGLWTMQSTALHPVNHAAAYRDLQHDAQLAEQLGFSAFWVAEHHFWYDGWCPAPLVAAAAAAAATSTIRVGTAMLLLPMHEAAAVARSSLLLDELSDGRFDLGVGLGYRDEEFDGLGVPRTQRGARMSANLDALLQVWADGDAVQQPHPPVWIGGMAPAALERGARRGLNFMLPPTLRVDQVAAAVQRIHDVADDAGVARGRIGMVKDTWVDSDGDRARATLYPKLTIGTREYGRGWWVFKNQFTGSDRPDLVESQISRAHEASLAGSPEEVSADLGRLRDAGVDVVCLHVNRAATRHQVRETMHLIADAVLPHFHEAVHVP